MLQIIDALPAQIAVLDRHGEVRATNRAWDLVAARGGLGSGREVGRRWNYLAECVAAADRGCTEAGEVAVGIQRVLDGSTELFVKSYPCAFEGLHRWYQVAVTPAPEGSQGRAIVMHTDVTALQHDPLTGLANRLLFDSQLDLALAQARRGGLLTGVILIDLDYFKAVNDRLGHLAGDRLLAEAARRLGQVGRAADLSARLGGDEFALVLGPTPAASPAEALARRIVKVLGEPHVIDGQKVDGSASVGLALWPMHGETAEALVEGADQALYAAKAAGRGCYRLAGKI